MDALLAAVEDDESGDEYFDVSPSDDTVDVPLQDDNGKTTAEEVESSSVAVATDDSGAEQARPGSNTVDDKALECKLTEFFPQENKMVYRIECSTTLPTFKKKEFDVLRKYEDFLWLHDRLRENRDLAGVLIPHLPPKVTWVSPEASQIAQKVSYNDGLNVKLTDQFQRRAHQLYRFLKRVCRHELLRKDIHVVVFLEYPEELRPINKKSWWHSPWYIARAGVHDDPDGAIVRRWANRYSNELVKTCPAAEAMTLASRGIATAEIAFMHELKKWTGDHRIIQVFKHFSSGLIRSQINHHLRAQIEETIFELLEDYTGTVNATKGMLDRVNSLSSELDEVQKHRVKATNAMPPAGDPRSDRQKGKLEKLNEEFTKARDSVAEAKRNRQQEIDLAQKRRIWDFKETFVALCEHEIHQGKLRIQSWAEVAQEIELLQQSMKPTEVENDSNELV